MRCAAFTLPLVTLLFSGCTKSMPVVRVGLDCVLSSSDAGTTVLPFGKWLTATVPRFGQASTVTIADHGKALGTVPSACVATVPPKARTLWGRESGGWVKPNEPSHLLDPIGHLVQAGHPVEVSGEGPHLLMIEKGLPRGIVESSDLTDQPVPYFAKLFDNAVNQGDDNLSVLSVAQALDPSLLAAPSVADAIPRMVAARLREGHLERLATTLGEMPDIRKRFPQLGTIFCDLAHAYRPGARPPDCAPHQFSLVVATEADGEELTAERAALIVQLTGPLYAIWRSNPEILPKVIDSDRFPGGQVGTTWMIIGVCPETQAKALHDLYRPFIGGLSLRETAFKADFAPCPLGPEYPHVGRFPEGPKLARYWQRATRWGSNSMVAVAFDDAGKPSSGWAPTTAFSLGRIDPFAPEPVRCFFNPDRHPLFAFDAACERVSEDTKVEQSGTFTLFLAKGKLRGKGQARGKPVRSASD
jgi:hypothetical protein